MSTQDTLVLHNIAVWDTKERIDLVVDSRLEHAIIEDNACTTGDIDASDWIVAPGFADPHVHFRDPGQSEKETMQTGANAAASGGYTQVTIMPNTIPAVDGKPWAQAPEGCENVIDYLQQYERIHHTKLPVHYDLAVAASEGRLGNKVSNIDDWSRYVRTFSDASMTASMRQHPVVAITDDGAAIPTSILYDVLSMAKAMKLPVVEHCEHHDSGSVNLGPVSQALNVEGIAASTEEDIVVRDIQAVRETGVHIHFQHVSTAGAFRAIREAKQEGLPITCETAPHYLALCDEDVLRYGAMAKMNPPLRSASDRQAALAAVADGTVDMIATDHAPHTVAEKTGEFIQAPNGIIGLETAYGVCRKVLVEAGYIDDRRLIELMALAPTTIMNRRPTDIAGLLNISAGFQTHRTLELSNTEHPEDIDLVLIDQSKEWTVDPQRFHSQACNTPFAGWKLKGRVMATVLSSCLAFSRIQQH